MRDLCNRLTASKILEALKRTNHSKTIRGLVCDINRPNCITIFGKDIAEKTDELSAEDAINKISHHAKHIDGEPNDIFLIALNSTFQEDDSMTTHLLLIVRKRWILKWTVHDAISYSLPTECDDCLAIINFTCEWNASNVHAIWMSNRGIHPSIQRHHLMDDLTLAMLRIVKPYTATHTEFKTTPLHPATKTWTYQPATGSHVSFHHILGIKSKKQTLRQPYANLAMLFYTQQYRPSNQSNTDHQLKPIKRPRTQAI